MFVFEGDPLGLEVHVFHVNKYTGVEAETEEMRPQWYTFDQFPFKSMWPDDELWISHLVKFDEAHHTGKPLEGFTATFLFGADQKTIINYQIDTYPVKLSKDAKSSVFADGLPEGFDVANQKWQTAP
ncbi:hypothetical protein BJ742DRAFT_77635 [Cladochytrium replicatum]|nr:hypothetical protein BJ742DRAFT_77635 [Cladochytrium replicatum]